MSSNRAGHSSDARERDVRMNATEWLKLNRCPWCKYRNRKKCGGKVSKTYNGYRCYGYRCDEEKRP